MPPRPSSESTATREPEEQKSGDTAALSNRFVLVVDDNPAVLKIMEALFREEGMKVRLASSVADAKVKLEAEGVDAFDLVLSDISMPGETGFDLLEWLKREDSPYAELPVLLTTAHLPEAENRLKGLALGAVDYVVRPIELKELVLRSINAIEHFRRIRSLETLLQDSENLAMVGRLLAASNHEIKNLAALVTICSDQIARAFPGIESGDSVQATALRSLQESAALLTDVARNTSNLLTSSEGSTAPLHVDPLVASMVKLMERRVRPYRIEIRSPEKKAHWVHGHEVRLKQVLINLILNASDAITELDPPEGGSIIVAVHDAESATEITVTDNGIGLDGPGMRTEFQAFSTTKKLRGGQGLGLWLCSRLVNGMGGRLSLRSSGVGQGATATVSLRRATPPDAYESLDISQYLID